MKNLSNEELIEISGGYATEKERSVFDVTVTAIGGAIGGIAGAIASWFK